MSEINAYSIVREFEERIADYAGSKYAVAVESCTAALFLCCKYQKVKWVHIPRYTYPGVANSIIHAGGKVLFHNDWWEGIYKLHPYEIYDSALRFQRGMYIKNSFYCLSFHLKKHLPIGRGGMILTDSENAARWLKRARFDGRDEIPLKDDNIETPGYNMYLTPDQAARGLMLFDMIKDKELKDLSCEEQRYPDLSKMKAYQ